MGDENTLSTPQLSAILVGIGIVFFLVTIYDCLVVGRYNRFRPNPSPRQPPVPARNTGFSTAQIIPAHNYTGIVGEDGTCAICLCEFEEGEDLRTLPECLHSYHASCIDMWFYSHSNCPICRTVAAVMPPQDLRPTEEL